MAFTLPAYLAPFAKRQPAIGSAYVLKDRLALADARSGLLGVDEGKMCASFVISTDDPDRVDDVVTTKGIDLTRFKANPIAFYGHQAIVLPIGKWATRDGDRCTIKLESHRAVGTCYFSQRSKQAAEVFDLVVEGILRATSIGFNPMAEPVPRDGHKSNPISLQRGFIFPRVDLLEVSIVGIPAQPTATLVREYLSGRKGFALDATIRKSLEPLAEPAPAWSNGATLPPEGEPMSKKWKKAPPAPKPVAKATDVQACVSDKIPKLRDEGFPEDQAIAIAEHMCGGKSEEEAKALVGSSGQGGGYLVPPGDRKKPDDKQGEPAVAKKPPPPSQNPYDAQGGGDPNDPDAEATEGQEFEEAPTTGHDAKDPIQIMVSLAESLLGYLEITAKRPQPAPAPVAEEEDEEEEEEDMPDQQQDQDEPVDSDRYEFRDIAPAKEKRGAYHATGKIKRCKDCLSAAAAHMKDLSEMECGGKWTAMHKAACLHHHKELSTAAADLDMSDQDDDAPGEPPVTKTVEELDDSIDAASIMRALSPVERRVAAVGSAWDSLRGEMPV